MDAPTEMCPWMLEIFPEGSEVGGGNGALRSCLLKRWCVSSSCADADELCIGDVILYIKGLVLLERVQTGS